LQQLFYFSLKAKGFFFGDGHLFSSCRTGWGVVAMLGLKKKFQGLERAISRSGNCQIWGSCIAATFRRMRVGASWLGENRLPTATVRAIWSIRVLPVPRDRNCAMGAFVLVVLP
jgi:hypothetical protein